MSPGLALRVLTARDVEDEAHVARAVGGHAGGRVLGGVDGVRAHADDPAAAWHADHQRVVALASGLQHARGGGLVGVQGGGAGAGDARAARDGQVEDALQAAAAQRGRGRLVRVEGGGVAAGDARVRDDLVGGRDRVVRVGDGVVDADDGGVAVRDELFEAGEAVLPLGAFGVPYGAFDDALEVAGADLDAVRGGDLHAQGDDAGLGDRPPGQRRPVCGGLLPAHGGHGHAVADLDARRGVVGERHALDAGRGGDWLAVVGDGDGDGASVLVAGVESDVGDPAVGEVEADGRLGDVAESVEGHFPVPFVRSLRWAMASRRRRRASSPEVSAAASLAVASAVGWGSRMSATASSASVMSVTRLAT